MKLIWTSLLNLTINSGPTLKHVTQTIKNVTRDYLFGVYFMITDWILVITCRNKFMSYSV